MNVCFCWRYDGFFFWALKDTPVPVPCITAALCRLHRSCAACALRKSFSMNWTIVACSSFCALFCVRFLYPMASLSLATGTARAEAPVSPGRAGAVPCPEAAGLLLPEVCRTAQGHRLLVWPHAGGGMVGNDVLGAAAVPLCCVLRRVQPHLMLCSVVFSIILMAVGYIESIGPKVLET